MMYMIIHTYDVGLVVMFVSALYLNGIVDLEPFPIGIRLGRYKLAHLIVKKE